MSDIDNNYIGIVLEDIRDQNTTILEAVGSMQDKIETLATKEDLARLETKVDVIQFALTDTNKDVANLKQRVTKLEQTAK